MTRDRYNHFVRKSIDLQRARLIGDVVVLGLRVRLQLMSGDGIVAAADFRLAAFHRHARKAFLAHKLAVAGDSVAAVRQRRAIIVLARTVRRQLDRTLRDLQLAGEIANIVDLTVRIRPPSGLIAEISRIIVNIRALAASYGYTNAFKREALRCASNGRRIHRLLAAIVDTRLIINGNGDLAGFRVLRHIGRIAGNRCLHFRLPAGEVVAFIGLHRRCGRRSFALGHFRVHHIFVAAQIIQHAMIARLIGDGELIGIIQLNHFARLQALMVIAAAILQHIVRQILADFIAQFIAEDIQLAICFGILCHSAHFYAIDIDNDGIRNRDFLAAFRPNGIQRDGADAICSIRNGCVFKLAHIMRGVGKNVRIRALFIGRPALENIRLAAHYACRHSVCHREGSIRGQTGFPTDRSIVAAAVQIIYYIISIDLLLCNYGNAPVVIAAICTITRGNREGIQVSAHLGGGNGYRLSCQSGIAIARRNSRDQRQIIIIVSSEVIGYALFA